MRELTLREIRLPAGGGSEEFRTLVRHDIPRWNEPPNHWTLSLESPAATEPASPPDTVAQHSPTPVPLRWLPCSDEWPEIF
ncbi:MAG: hypothetical protein OXI11_11630 [Gammaproteobacteria bacterium]|nr:hypothetical protein [Gammaproteobacteria bacterium]MXW44820.1 hypothetical protein [Gammaproteobacteria bacterium]MYD02053.1 hypothetical protein [Gammaproteobacteria bacterium]MYI24016.1 hypothetical protein [Gammaproteobacteria bacterium]